MDIPKTTESFSFHVFHGEAIVAGRTVTTPKSVACLVTGAEEELTTKVMREWFIQSIVPLVGQKAAGVLNKIITGAKRDGEKFLTEGIEFRKSLM